MSHTNLRCNNAHSFQRIFEFKLLWAFCQGQVKTLYFALLFTLTSCSGVFYQPIKGALFAPERVGLQQEEVWLESQDGTKIFGWAFRAQNPKGTIIQFHGNAENMSSHFLNLVWLIKEGYDLLVFDYRGYGFSEGVPTQPGVHMDALRALDWAFHDHQKRKTKKFIVFAQSLGGQIGARAVVDFTHQKDVNLLVLDSTFASYQTIAAQKLRSSWITWLFFPLAYLTVSDQYASEKVLDRIEIPVLMMHAPHDPVVPYSMGKDVYRGLKTKKWWWEVKDGKHTDAFHLPKTPFRKKFLELIDQV